MGDQYLLEHRERRLTRRVRHNRLRIALAIAAAEGILVIAGVLPWWVVVLLAMIAVAGITVAAPLAAPVAAADPAGRSGEYTDFYLPPDPLPAGSPGDVLRVEPSVAAIVPGTPLAIDATVTRVMYRSVGAAGDPVAVTGTVPAHTSLAVAPGST